MQYDGYQGIQYLFFPNWFTISRVNLPYEKEISSQFKCIFSKQATKSTFKAAVQATDPVGSVLVRLVRWWWFDLLFSSTISSKHMTTNMAARRCVTSPESLHRQPLWSNTVCVFCVFRQKFPLCRWMRGRQAEEGFPLRLASPNTEKNRREKDFPLLL